MRKAVFACPIGKEKRSETNVTCRSCIEQGVSCPFACAQEKSPAIGQISQPVASAETAKKRKGPNKSEMAYGLLLKREFPQGELVTEGLHLRISHSHIGDMSLAMSTVKIVYEGLTIELENGHCYTADWAVFFPDGSILLAEVKPAKGKSGFRHGSYQRAKCMFDQCVVDFPHWSWRWAEKAGASWDVKTIAAKITKGER